MKAKSSPFENGPSAKAEEKAGELVFYSYFLKKPAN